MIEYPKNLLSISEGFFYLIKVELTIPLKLIDKVSILNLNTILPLFHFHRCRFYLIIITFIL